MPARSHSTRTWTSWWKIVHRKSKISWISPRISGKVKFQYANGAVLGPAFWRQERPGLGRTCPALLFWNQMVCRTARQFTFPGICQIPGSPDSASKIWANSLLIYETCDWSSHVTWMESQSRMYKYYQVSCFRDCYLLASYQSRNKHQALMSVMICRWFFHIWSRL